MLNLWCKHSTFFSLINYAATSFHFKHPSGTGIRYQKYDHFRVNIHICVRKTLYANMIFYKKGRQMSNTNNQMSNFVHTNTSSKEQFNIDSLHLKTSDNRESNPIDMPIEIDDDLYILQANEYIELGKL